MPDLYENTPPRMIRPSASFRDPDGFCIVHESRVFRFVHAHAAKFVRDLVQSAYFRRWIEDGWLPETRELSAAEADETATSVLGRTDFESLGSSGLVLEQERIPFVSYPHEWSPEMLHAAGELTLNLHLAALEHGLMLKDATPWNVLFRGSQPVFVDVLSIVVRPTGMAIWPAYAQFVRTFVLPLLLHRQHGGGTHEVFVTHRDGLEPEEVYARLSWAERLAPSALKSASLPAWLGGAKKAKETAPSNLKPIPEERAKALAPMLVGGLRRSLASVNPKQRGSNWSDYTATSTYDAAATKAKEEFVREAMARWQPRLVLDVGCNTGHYSRIVAEGGASVVAIDYDQAVIGRVFSRRERSGDRILPLVVNLAWPTPALGWRNGESSSFLTRAEGTFDAALLLAVVHHLTVTDGVPLSEVFRLLAGIVRQGAVVEYVPPSDPQFKRIVRNKEHLIPLLGRSDFEHAFAPWFATVSIEPVRNSGRIIYCLVRKPAANFGAVHAV